MNLPNPRTAQSSASCAEYFKIVPTRKRATLPTGMASPKTSNDCCVQLPPGMVMNEPANDHHLSLLIKRLLALTWLKRVRVQAE